MIVLFFVKVLDIWAIYLLFIDFIVFCIIVLLGKLTVFVIWVDLLLPLNPFIALFFQSTIILYLIYSIKNIRFVYQSWFLIIFQFLTFNFLIVYLLSCSI